MDKDVTILDKFNVKTDASDLIILPKEEKTKKINNVKDPAVVFNPKTVNIQKVQYVKYQEFSLEDDDVFVLNHSLKDLNIKALEILPVKNFRDKKISFKNDNKSSYSTMTVFKRSKTTSITVNSSTFRASMTGLSITGNNKSSLNDTTMSRPISDFIRPFYLNDQASKVLDKVDYKTLNKEFLTENNLLETRQQQAQKNLKLIKKNAKKENAQDIKNEIQKIKQYDNESNTKKNILWSHQDVLNFPEDNEKYDEWNKEINNLEDIGVILWIQKPFLKQIQYLRYLFFVLSFNQYFDLFIIGVVIVNTVFMAFDGNLIQPESLDQIGSSKYYFNSIYIMEFLVKIIGMGPIMYFSELFSYLDVAIISFAILEMATEGNSSINISQLSFLRVFRIFRVLRLLKVLRKIKSIRKIISGITKAISSVAYILLILVIFILIFQLLGMTLLSKDNGYKDFINSFYETFQLLTMENWNTNIIRLDKLSGLTVIYLIIWIFFGNWVLFNLFLSILLDSFNEEPYQGIVFPHNYPETLKPMN